MFSESWDEPGAGVGEGEKTKTQHILDVMVSFPPDGGKSALRYLKESNLDLY